MVQGRACERSKERREWEEDDGEEEGAAVGGEQCVLGFFCPVILSPAVFGLSHAS